ncbi:4Fe-4S ferredoxin [Nautilia sp. PV-1]|uniref:lactate utilization protein B n=1 Tax=Nautilia sp. PV-1 TaxID=2579250 RepID=UPI000FD7F6EB|nr:lactate utilization protein B [Nautilia sp. PV-1]AZV47248.1 4Fe-4S ferredoxin [Nautilia sp. PV-1]
MKHYELAVKFYKQKGPRHDKSLWAIRQKRDKAIKEVKEWEELRNKASEIKDYVIENLHSLVDEFIKNAKNAGIEVIFAKDAKEHNETVLKYLKEINAKKAVKSKSMLTEECGLNVYLHDNGIEVIDTDLGERIVQLRGEKPSHIVLPAIHTTKEDVAEILNETNTDPTYLTHKMRALLRKEFLSADAGLSGANFLVADKGWAVVCTNEGNADLGAVLPPLHIISVGIEKIVPNMKDLGVFLRMLARNATGQKITTYTSIFGKKDNGKRVIILVDNGRFERLESEFKETLKCIKCSACLTTCPVFRRSGGHSYRYVIPGPIGSLLAPLTDKDEYSDLPFACTLCGSCETVCPVKIPFTKQLVNMRHYVKKIENGEWKMENFGVRLAEKAMHSPKMFKLFSTILRLTPKPLLESMAKEWSRYKALPAIPKERFIK